MTKLGATLGIAQPIATLHGLGPVRSKYSRAGPEPARIQASSGSGCTTARIEHAIPSSSTYGKHGKQFRGAASVVFSKVGSREEFAPSHQSQGGGGTACSALREMTVWQRTWIRFRRAGGGAREGLPPRPRATVQAFCGIGSLVLDEQTGCRGLRCRLLGVAR